MYKIQNYFTIILTSAFEDESLESEKERTIAIKIQII